VVARPLPAAPLVVHCRYLNVAPSGAARCLSQVLDRGAETVTRGAACRASQILDLDAQAGGGATLIAVRLGRQRRDAAAAGEEQLGRCTAGRLYPSRRCTWLTPTHV
jgi:hypothetical protein